MKILLVSPRGFCAGVRMAVEALDEVLSRVQPPVYVFHEIVHNKHIVERFKDRGVVFVDRIEEVPEGATLLFSAHGVSPAVRSASENRKLVTVDATCPLVTKVHHEAIRFASEGYNIVLIGHVGHDEVKGTVGEAPDRIYLVQNEGDVDMLQLRGGKIAYLTQTTLSVDDASRIMARLKARFPGIVSPPKGDICYATQNRQDAVRVLAKRVELVLVVGSQNSSNSIRLTEVAKEQGVPAVLVEGPKSLDIEAFSGTKSILLTAGASAPDDLVWGVIQRLKEHYEAEVEEVVLQEENVYFGKPRELRSLGSEKRLSYPV